MTEANYILELIDILAKPIQDGGHGMADSADSPLMKLKEKILADENAGKVL